MAREQDMKQTRKKRKRSLTPTLREMMVMG
jgi:hypothetical protein